MHCRSPWRGLDWVRARESMNSRKVVFFFPAFSSKEATAPLGILAVATPLLRAGYQVRLIDSTITPNFEQTVLAELEDALCLAVSLVTGPMIRETVQMARKIEGAVSRPADHSGRLASVAAAGSNAGGGICRRRGGGARRRRAARDRRSGLTDGESLKGIEGVGYKEDGQLVFNPPRKLKTLFASCRRRRITWRTSTRMNACADAAGRCTRRAWRVLTIVRIARTRACTAGSGTRSSRSRWPKRPPIWRARYNLELLWIVDDNFLVDTERALGIAEGLVKRNARFEWSIQASTNLVDRLTVDELKTAAPRRSRADAARRGYGIARVMHLMNKDFQQIETIYSGGGKLHAGGHSAVVQHDLRVSGRARAGPARESVAHDDGHLPQLSGRGVLDQYFHAVSGLADDGTAFELGIDVPKTARRMGDFFPRYTVLPWLKGKNMSACKTCASICAWRSIACRFRLVSRARLTRAGSSN